MGFCEPVAENLITMSFTADGTGIYNNSSDKNEGITYAGIHGMLSVDWQDIS